MKRNPSTWALLVALSLLVFAFAGCSDDDDDPTGPGGTTPVDQFEAVRGAAATFLAGPTPISTSIALNDLLTNSSANDDPFVLSVRSADHFAIGHVPSAVNVPWRTVAEPTNLALLPTDDPIVAYCYTGHTGQVATTVLGMLGYDVTNMKFGIMAWTKDAAVRVASPYSPPTEVYPIETTANTPSATYALPELDVSSSEDAMEIVRAAAAAYLPGASPTISAADVVSQGLDSFFVLSVRSETHYAIGHIPGAINIPWKTIADEANLEKLPTDETILVYCYTGHTGQIATTVLNLLGYDAVNLRHGMAAWTSDSTYMGGVDPFEEASWPDLDTQP